MQPLQQRRRLPVPQPDTGPVARGTDLGGGSTLPKPGRIRAGSVLASLPLHQLCLPLPCCLPVGFGRSPLSQVGGKSLPSCLHFQFCDTVKLISRAVKLLPVGQQRSYQKLSRSQNSLARCLLPQKSAHARCVLNQNIGILKCNGKLFDSHTRRAFSVYFYSDLLPAC